MPIYVYCCDKCSHQFDHFCKSFKDRPATIVCSVCGGIAVPIISPTSFAFKGEGFYDTDYKDIKRMQKKNEKLKEKK